MLVLNMAVEFSISSPRAVFFELPAGTAFFSSAGSLPANLPGFEAFPWPSPGDRLEFASPYCQIDAEVVRVERVDNRCIAHVRARISHPDRLAWYRAAARPGADGTLFLAGNYPSIPAERLMEAAKPTKPAARSSERIRGGIL